MLFPFHSDWRQSLSKHTGQFIITEKRSFLCISAYQAASKDFTTSREGTYEIPVLQLGCGMEGAQLLEYGNSC